MLGMSRWSPTCLTREEFAASDWMGELWLRGAELLKNALQNEECGVATVILRERAKRWQQDKNKPQEGMIGAEGSSSARFGSSEERAPRHGSWMKS